jgi:hypothetical protein
MVDILRGFDFCLAYLDNTLALSRSLEEHEQYLFTQIQRHGIIIIPQSASSEHPSSTSSVTGCPLRVPNL